MITEEDKQEIIDKAVEKALLLLPKVVGNLMAEAATMNKVNRKFYADYPEFKNHTKAVASIVEKIQSENTLMKHKDILKKAVPEIRELIKNLDKIDTQTVAEKPNLNFNGLL